MPSCCYPDEYGRLFNGTEAARAARRYRRRGLVGSARDLAQALRTRGIEGLTVLEAGGGVGAIQAELLAAGAARAVNVELSPEWEGAAADLFADLGMSGRVERRLGDFVDEAEALSPADVVILHRVVCCYPSWERLLAAGISHARQLLALTFPVDRWPVRTVIGFGNVWMRLRRRSFRAFVHSPEAMMATAAEAGFVPGYDRSGRVWRTVVLERR